MIKKKGWLYLIIFALLALIVLSVGISNLRQKYYFERMARFDEDMKKNVSLLEGKLICGNGVCDAGESQEQYCGSQAGCTSNPYYCAKDCETKALMWTKPPQSKDCFESEMPDCKSSIGDSCDTKGTRCYDGCQELYCSDEGFDEWI